jgi:hypothetical protein
MMDSNPDFWALYRPKLDDSKSLFYRYEAEGILVYDSSARFFDEPCNLCRPLESNPVSHRKKVEILDAEEYGTA